MNPINKRKKKLEERIVAQMKQRQMHFDRKGKENIKKEANEQRERK